MPERCSAARKTELVLRLLRAEALDAVSRESRVPAHELEGWKRVFLEQGTRGLRTRAEPEERELTLARAKIGELMMRLELAEDLIEKRGLHGRVEEAGAMKGRVSRATQRTYPLTMICAVYRAARRVCTPPAGRRRRPGRPESRDRRRGTAMARSSRRSAPSSPPAHSKGRAIEKCGPGWLTAGGKRVLRLMHAHGLLAPRRLGPPHGNPAHDGTIITDRPDVMWGTDATRFYIERDGWCWFFGAIDHHLDEVVGWHTAKLGDRWAALEPIRQGVRHAFGSLQQGRRAGLGPPL